MSDEIRILNPQEDRDALYAEVTDWVAEQKAAGRTVTNDQAPCWPAYQLAERALARSTKSPITQLDAKTDETVTKTVLADPIKYDDEPAPKDGGAAPKSGGGK